MTERQLRGLVQKWAGRLGLDRWRIDVQIGGLQEETSLAEVDRSSSYQRAVVRFAPWLIGQGERPADVLALEHTDDFVAAVVAHELLHLWTRDLRAIVKDDIAEQVHPDAHRAIDAAAERAEEQLVDGLAEALVRAWPAEPRRRSSRPAPRPRPSTAAAVKTARRKAAIRHRHRPPKR